MKKSLTATFTGQVAITTKIKASLDEVGSHEELHGQATKGELEHPQWYSRIQFQAGHVPSAPSSGRAASVHQWHPRVDVPDTIVDHASICWFFQR